jgi:predicted dehydrogenase/nucleoside-diphosphate-sugar epimerase
VSRSNLRRVGILGAGYISEFHVEALRGLRSVEVTAVCDLDREKAQALATRLGIARVHTSIDEMLAAGALDAVHVLLPPQHHAAAVLQLLDAGLDVFVEKPLGISADECRAMAQRARERGRLVGVSHNFLFSPNYDAFARDLAAGRFGRIDQVDIVWNKELGQVRGGPFGGWLFARPENVLFEVGPHSFAHVAHILGGLDDVSGFPRDEIRLPGGKPFFRRWEVLGFKGPATARLRFAFADSFTQHYVLVRGTRATARIDFEQNTYVCSEHTGQMLDVDRFATTLREATGLAAQGTATLSRFVLSKAGLGSAGAPFPRSIAASVRSFHDGLTKRALDPRIDAALATRAIEIGEQVVARTGLADASSTIPARQPDPMPLATAPSVLVLGGTGFIGRALVQQLVAAGHGVRLLARNPAAAAETLPRSGIELVKGDVLDPVSVEGALAGITRVFHLARGHGETWDDYVRTDIEPTRRLVEQCLSRKIERLLYVSSIAIYNAGRGAGTITERTAPDPGVLASSVYARSKAEIERMLVEANKTRGLPAVILRPGIVLGSGGNPLHWGIASWPFNSVARLYGDGRSPLPIVLVDDCADAMVRAMDAPGIDGDSFNLVGEPLITAQDYFDELETASGLSFTRLPTSTLRYVAEDWLKYAIKTAGRDPNRARPSWSASDGRTCAAAFSHAHAAEKLGWVPERDPTRVIHEGIVVPAREFLG